MNRRRFLTIGLGALAASLGIKSGLTPQTSIDPLNDMDLAAFRKSLGSGTDEEKILACHAIDPRIEDIELAEAFIHSIIRRLLNANRYRAAAHVLWGPELFDPRPISVQRLLHAVESHAKVIVLGSGSSGKSYSIIAYLLLDWLRDPEYTGVRIISTTSSHALANTFSTLQRFYDESIIKLPGFSQHGFIGLDPKDRHASLSVIAIKQGESGNNSLQGFHPIRRRNPHPIFGSLSRIRLFLDEAELIPQGVWKGVNNLLGNLSGINTVKAICATNPWDVTSILASNAEPLKGYSQVDIDRDDEWESRNHWHTIRIDAAQSENVTTKRNVFPGLMTYEGYEEYRSKSNGDDPEYYCYARGMYPTQGSVDCLIPLNLLDDSFGTWLFQPGTVIGTGAIDLAFEGDDDVIFFAGRYGRATGFQPVSGSVITLSQPRWVLQADQFFTLKKLRTEAQSNQIKEMAANLAISPEYIAVDKTGAGHGVADILVERGWRGMMEIGWGQAATHSKILREDRTYADEVCDGIAYEMYVSLKSYLEFGYIKLNPAIDMARLQKEIIGRKRLRSGLGHTGEVRFRLEPKEQFKKRYGFSPDRADALVMMLQVARIRAPERATIAKTAQVRVPRLYEVDPLGKVAFIDFSQEG